jgi:type I restriction enzyme M protein
VLFIDASELGYMVDRKNRTFAPEDVSKVADTYHNWLKKHNNYEDIKGFCKSAGLEDIQKHKFVLTPGRYVGIPDEEDDGIPFQEKVDRLTTRLREQMNQAQTLDQEIKEQLAKIGIEL